MKTIVAILFAVGLALAACGYQEAVIQRADRSFLKFTGNWPNAVVQVDSLPPFSLTPKGTAGDAGAVPDNTLYQVAPGRHRITVTRGSQVMVDRVIVLDNQVTMEILIP